MSSKGALKGVSLADIGAEIKRTDSQGKVTTTSPSIIDGFKPLKRNFKEGYHIIRPEELLALLVPRQEVVGGKIHGFQRPKVTKPHIRKIASAIESGDPLSPIEVGAYRNAFWIIDGQHRALGAIIARQSIPAVVRKLTAEEMQKLFASQGKGRNVNPSILILSASDEFSKYVQDAVVNTDNPWNKLVTHNVSSQKKLTPKQVFDSLGRYVANALGQTHVARNIESYSFDKEKADELARLFITFGNKQTNPLAFRPVAVKAIAYAATIIIRRTGSNPADISRWEKHMPTFPWEEWLGVRKSRELALLLIRHWNKRLSQNNRIKLPEELT